MKKYAKMMAATQKPPKTACTKAKDGKEGGREVN